MKKSEHALLRRYLMFLVSLFIIAFGTSLSIRANLGSSPISCPPYVLSLVPGIGLTMGTLVFCMHAILIVLQILILRRRYQVLQLLQLVVGIVFGFFTDLTMWLTGYMQIMDNSAVGYSFRLMELLCGGAILAYGIAVEVKCDVLMLATEGTQVVISRVMKEEGVWLGQNGYRHHARYAWHSFLSCILRPLAMGTYRSRNIDFDVLCRIYGPYIQSTSRMARPYTSKR